MLLRGSRLSLDIGGYRFRGWFVLQTLAKYDIILSKSWMEEVPHRVDLNRTCYDSERTHQVASSGTG